MSLNRCVPLSGFSHLQTFMGFLSSLTSIQDHTATRDNSICKFHFFFSTGSVTLAGGRKCLWWLPLHWLHKHVSCYAPLYAFIFCYLCRKVRNIEKKKKKRWKSGSKEKGFKYSFQHSNEQFTSLQLIALESNKIEKHKQNQNWLALLLPLPTPVHLKNITAGSAELCSLVSVALRWALFTAQAPPAVLATITKGQRWSFQSGW